MRIAHRIVPALVLSLALATHAQQTTNPLTPYIKEDAPLLILNHVNIIDGTGAASQPDMRIEISHGRITAISAASANTPVPAGAKVLDLTGKTVIPGLVGMHEHLFYPLPDRPAGGLALYGEMADSAPRLYLAGGVTTARTGGSVEPYTDLELKRAIDAGKIPGPKLDVTGPYLEGPGTFAIQMHQLADAADAARTVDYWAAEGVTSFKAYNYLTAAALKAAIDRAHAHHLKITGHLCSIGFRQAADLGIDNLEHGIVVDTEFDPQKQPDECNASRAAADMAKNLNIDGPQVHAMIDDLVAHHVAVTSTLAIFETFGPGRPPLAREAAALKELTPDAERDYLFTRAAVAERPGREKMLQIEMKFEREFVAAGGMLMAGCDPTGYGGVLPGFGDQRNLELLVEAGFTPLQAIRIATLNGAKFLGRDADIGSVAVGKSADLIVLGGDPTQNINNVEKVETVFKDGVGYNPAALIEPIKTVGLR